MISMVVQQSIIAANLLSEHLSTYFSYMQANTNSTCVQLCLLLLQNQTFMYSVCLQLRDLKCPDPALLASILHKFLPFSFKSFLDYIYIYNLREIQRHCALPTCFVRGNFHKGITVTAVFYFCSTVNYNYNFMSRFNPFLKDMQ